MTLAIGPIKVPKEEVAAIKTPVDTKFVVDYTAGLFFGFSGNDYRQKLATCLLA